jgi:hypothetical protein
MEIETAKVHEAGIQIFQQSSVIERFTILIDLNSPRGFYFSKIFIIVACVCVRSLKFANMDTRIRELSPPQCHCCRVFHSKCADMRCENASILRSTE